MHAKILLGVRYCAMCIFIYILFLENLGRMLYTALVNLYDNYVTEPV